MELDALTAFLDGAIHLALRSLGSLMIAHGVKWQLPGEIVFVGSRNRIKTPCIGRIAVVEDIILHLGSMIRTSERRVFLSGTRRQHAGKNAEYE